MDNGFYFEGGPPGSHTAEHRKILSNTWLGNKHSEETKTKMSAAKKGKPSPKKGKKSNQDYSYMKTKAYGLAQKNAWVRRKQREEGLVNAD